MEAIVLAGGLGTRLRSVVSDLPKCMAPIQGRPFLQYLLEDLGSKGFRHVILSLGYKHEAIETWIATIQWPFRISFSVEDTPLGTGGAIQLAMEHATEPDVFVLNGDTFFDVDFHQLLLKHYRASATLSIALKPMVQFDRYGTVVTDSAGLVLNFVEKKPCSEGLINGGIYLMKHPLPLFPAGKETFSFETEVLQPGVTGGGLYGFTFDGYFIDIGIPDDYAKASDDFSGWNVTPGFTKNASSWNTLFLDRDGVLNEHRPDDYVKKWEEFRFLPGVFEALALLSDRFEHIVVVTNQRGVGKGLMREQDLEEIHNRMLEEIQEKDGRIDRIYCCTAVEPSHPLRKPNVGMGLSALEDFPDLDFSRSILVGDSESDIEFGERLGIKTYKVNQQGERDGLLRFARTLYQKT